jgi:hypothetical protein
MQPFHVTTSPNLSQTFCLPYHILASIADHTLTSIADASTWDKDSLNTVGTFGEMTHFD